jgi:hypothetical protein
MAIYGGVFNTTKNPAELNAKSFAATILRRFPNGSAPLFGMSALSGKSKAVSSTHGYFTKTMEFSRVVTSAAYVAGDATLAVVSSAGIVPGHVIYNPTTGENIRVLTVPSATSITVTRGFGRIAAGAIASGATLIAVGNAHAEGSARPTPRSLSTVYVSNFTQIFRNAWALTDTARASYAEMGYSNIAENKQDCMTFHSTDIESAILFGQPKMDTSGTQPIHATQGIIDAIKQYAPGNVSTAGGTTTYDQLVSMVETAFQYSTSLGESKTRALFGDQQAIKVLNAIGRKFPNDITMTQKETSYGMQFTEFRFYKGSINLIEHPLLNGLATAPGLAVIVDLPALKLAPMDGRDTKNESYGVGGTNSDGSGIDSQGGSLLTELAVELINPASCAVINGLTAAA